MVNCSRFNRKVNVDEIWLDKKFKKCPFCLSENIKQAGLIQKNPAVYICECTECKIGYVDRQPIDEFLIDYYRNYYSDQERKTTISPEKLAKHIYKILQPILLKQKYSILDFGGGNGSVSLMLTNILLKRSTAAQADITLIDLFPQILKYENENIKLISYLSLEKVPENQTFDIIIASAILEHIRNPRETLQKLLTLLKKGGFIYCRTPYILPFFKVLKKAGIYVDIQFPGHLFDMGNLFWKNSLNKLKRSDDYFIRRSQTAIAEDLFRESFFKALVVRIFKFPSRFFRYQYHLVGGWEVLIGNK